MESQNNLKNFIVSPQGKTHVLLYRTDYWCYLHSSRVVGECSSSPPRSTAQFHRVISVCPGSQFFTSLDTNTHHYYVDGDDCCDCGRLFHPIDRSQKIRNIEVGNLWLNSGDDNRGLFFTLWGASWRFYWCGIS